MAQSVARGFHINLDRSWSYELDREVGGLESPARRMAAMAADPVFVAIGQPFQADVTLESLT